MKKQTIWLIVFIAAALILAGGCSKDSTSTDELSQGNPNDPIFLQAKQSSEELIGEMLGGVDEGIGYLDYEGGNPLMKPADTLFITMYEDYWYEYRFELMTTEGSWAQSDSFRFESGVEEYQQFPDSNTTAFEFRNWLLLEFAEADTSTMIANHAAYRFTGINDDLVTINGISDSGMEMTIGANDASMDFESELDDVVYAAEDMEYGQEYYPISGTATLSVAVHADEQIGDVPAMNYAWTLIVTFNENGYHARLEAGDFYWEWDETWDPV